MSDSDSGGRDGGRTGRIVLARLRVVYLAVLPVAGVLFLSREGWRIPGWLAVFTAIGIFVAGFLQAALIRTEFHGSRSRPATIRWAVIVVLVGVAVAFDWRRWIMEQFLLEIASFSVAVALIALRKAAEEGGIVHGPWLVVLIVFVLPAAGIVTVCVRGLSSVSPSFPDSVLSLALGGAFLLAVFDGVQRLRPYTLGGRQLREPFAGGPMTVFVAGWLIILLVGVPIALSR